MAEAGRATVRFVGDFSQLNAGLTSTLSSSKLGALGKGAGVAVGAGIGVAVVAEVGKQLYKIGDEFDSGFDAIRVGTGKTGDPLLRLQKSLKNVVRDVPTDFGAAGDAVADLNTRLGLTGPRLEKQTKQFLELSRVTGTDLQDNIQSVTRLYGDWSVKTRSQSSTLDKLFRLSQSTGIAIGDLSQYMVQFGSPLRQLGFDFDTAAAMFAKFEKEGVNLQTAMPGLRMALKNFASDNRDPQRALERTIEQIESAGSAAEANTMAFDVFGVRAGPDLAAAIREGRFEFDGLIREMNGGRDTIIGAAEDTNDLSENWKIFTNRLKTEVEPIATAVFNTVGDAVGGLTDALDALEDTPVGNQETWRDILGDAFEISKAFAQLPIDPDGGIKRFLNVLGGGGEEVSRIRATINAREDAAKSLGRVSRIAGAARGRATRATVAEREAEADLRRARKQFGDGSSEVLAAEVRLQRAKRRTIRLTKEAKNAERVEGVERKVLASRTRDQVVQEKSRITVLNRSIRTLGRRWQVERRNNGNTERARELEQQIIDKLKSRDNTQKRLNDVLSDAARQIGPKYAKSLQSINGRQATFEAVLGRLPKKAGNLRSALGQLPGPIEKVGRTAKNEIGVKARDALNEYAEAVVDKRRQVNSNMRLMPQVQIVATDRMIEDFAEKVGAVKNDGTPQQKRRGGLIELVQGFRNGGVPVALSSGEMFKTPDGKTGVVPGRPTASDNVLTSMPVGTKVFTFDGQRRLMSGESEASALRNQLPHFASGGIVKPEIMGGSPKARELANTAIDRLHEKASSRLRRAKTLAARGAPGGSWSGGSGRYPGVSGDTDFIPALGNALSAMSKAAGQSIYVRSGWRSYEEQAALYAAYLNGTGNLAAPPGSSNHESGRAADISPGAEAFGSLAGRFGLGFTVPSESWHIELLRRGGIVGLLQRLAQGGEVVRIAAPLLTRKGFDHKATAGIMGNAWGESSWNPAAMEPGTDNGGLFGFTAYEKSLANMRAYAASRGKPWTDVATQIGFMLQSGGMSLKGRMNALDSIPDTTKLFMDEYERPGIPRLEERIKGGFMASDIMRGMKLGGPGGMSGREKAKAAAANRREAREKQVQNLIRRAFAAKATGSKKGAFWQILDLYAKYGDFGVSKGGMLGGGVTPGGKSFEAQEFIQRAASIASITNPQHGSGQLYSLVKWLQGNVELTGQEDANKRLFSRLEAVQSRGESRAKKKRDRILTRISRKGSDYPNKKRLLANDRIIRTADEWIELAQRKHQSEGSAGGSEYTDAEVDYEKRLYSSLLGSLRDRKGMIAGSLRFVGGQQKNLEERLKTAPAWRKPALRKALANTRSTMSNLRTGWEELVGLTGQGGRIGDVKASLADLGVRTTVEKQALQGIGIGDLRQIIEFAGLGGYANMPAFHGGGMYRAPAGQSEGPALLRDREMILTPEQQRAMGGRPVFVLKVEDGAVNSDRIKLIADGRIQEWDRASDQLVKGMGV